MLAGLEERSNNLEWDTGQKAGKMAMHLGEKPHIVAKNAHSAISANPLQRGRPHHREKIENRPYQVCRMRRMHGICPHKAITIIS